MASSSRLLLAASTFCLSILRETANVQPDQWPVSACVARKTTRRVPDDVNGFLTGRVLQETNVQLHFLEIPLQLLVLGGVEPILDELGLALLFDLLNTLHGRHCSTMGTGSERKGSLSEEERQGERRATYASGATKCGRT
jgi:hypothetical protein